MVGRAVGEGAARDRRPEKGPRQSLHAPGDRWDLFETLARADGPPVRALIDVSGAEAHRCAFGRREATRLGDELSRAETRRRDPRAHRPGLKPARHPADGWTDYACRSEGNTSGNAVRWTIILPENALQ